VTMWIAMANRAIFNSIIGYMAAQKSPAESAALPSSSSNKGNAPAFIAPFANIEKAFAEKNISAILAQATESNCLYLHRSSL